MVLYIRLRFKSLKLIPLFLTSYIGFLIDAIPVPVRDISDTCWQFLSMSELLFKKVLDWFIVFMWLITIRFIHGRVFIITKRSGD